MPGGEFEWFIIGGDDYFVIAENLKAYLASDEVCSVFMKKEMMDHRGVMATRHITRR